MRHALALSLLLVSAVPALAQEGASFRPFSPISGPNDAIPSPVCDLINFGFCPQPPPPAPPLPDINDAAAHPPPPPLHHRRGHRRHPVAQPG